MVLGVNSVFGYLKDIKKKYTSRRNCCTERDNYSRRPDARIAPIVRQANDLFTIVIACALWREPIHDSWKQSYQSHIVDT